MKIRKLLARPQKSMFDANIEGTARRGKNGQRVNGLDLPKPADR
jgi:hypothetical protein